MAWPAQRRAGSSGSAAFEPPPMKGDTGPHDLDQSEWPGSLEEAVSRSQYTGTGKPQDAPVVPLLECVEEQHRRDSQQPEYRQSTHFPSSSAIISMRRRGRFTQLRRRRVIAFYPIRCRPSRIKAGSWFPPLREAVRARSGKRRWSGARPVAWRDNCVRHPGSRAGSQRRGGTSIR